MKHRRLGKTGLTVSEICLGTMTFGSMADEETSRAILDKAFEAGVAPPVVLEATHALALEFSSLDDLRAHATAD